MLMYSRMKCEYRATNFRDSTVQVLQQCKEQQLTSTKVLDDIRPYVAYMAKQQYVQSQGLN